jgi:phosphate starvation-inducible protein PhoH and related proteins
MSSNKYSSQEPKKQRKPKRTNDKEIMNNVDLIDSPYTGTFLSCSPQQKKEYIEEVPTKNKSRTSSPNSDKSVQPINNLPLVGWTTGKIYEVLEKKMNSPKTRRQEEFVNLLKDKNKKIILVCGPAGTGKTLLSTQYGMKNFLLGVYEKLVFTRPSVAVDESIGFLPGSLEEKMAPWIRPIYDVINQFISQKEIEYLVEDKKIEIAPLGFMRGRTFKNTWIVADEMQNSTIEQMKMLMTRLGENSRLIITGDLEQSDLHRRMNGLDDFLIRFRGKRSDSISSFEFENNDIQREDVIKEILEIYCSP